MRRLAALSLLLASACAAPPRAAAPTLATLTHPGRITVVTFFSADCPCQRAHDDRLRALYARYHDRVDFVAVDAEVDATPARDAAEARARGYPFPITTDPEGRLADALGADVATFTVVLDGQGRLRYAGGIDSDRSHLTAEAKPWLQGALESLLAGRDPDPAEAKALGCALRRR